MLGRFEYRQATQPTIADNERAETICRRQGECQTNVNPACCTDC
jgi:hypothetical protein